MKRKTTLFIIILAIAMIVTSCGGSKEEESSGSKIFEPKEYSFGDIWNTEDYAFVVDEVVTLSDPYLVLSRGNDDMAPQVILMYYEFIDKRENPPELTEEAFDANGINRGIEFMNTVNDPEKCFKDGDGNPCNTSYRYLHDIKLELREGKFDPLLLQGIQDEEGGGIASGYFPIGIYSDKKEMTFTLEVEGKTATFKLNWEDQEE